MPEINKKIIYIVTQSEMGGAQAYTLMLAGHFNASIACGDGSGELFEAAAKQGIPILKLKHLKREIHPYYDFCAFLEICYLIYKLKPDIVHLNSSKAGILGSIAGKLFGCKVIYTAHGFVFNEYPNGIKKNLYIFIEKIASLFRTLIIAVSEYDRQTALKYGIVPANKITVIHNGIPKINFLERNEARKNLNLDNNNIAVGTVANYYKTKGLDILLQSIKILSEDASLKNIFPNIKFILIGKGTEEHRLTEQAKRLEISNSLILQPLNNAAVYLKALDIFVLPSRKEGLPFAVLEAMQASLPIIASDVGGIKEALGPEGKLVKPENPVNLAMALTEVIMNNQIKNELMHLSGERSLLFSETNMFAQTAEAYQSLYAGNAKNPE